MKITKGGLDNVVRVPRDEAKKMADALGVANPRLYGGHHMLRTDHFTPQVRKFIRGKGKGMTHTRFFKDGVFLLQNYTMDDRKVEREILEKLATNKPQLFNSILKRVQGRTEETICLEELREMAGTNKISENDDSVHTQNELEDGEAQSVQDIAADRDTKNMHGRSSIETPTELDLNTKLCKNPLETRASVASVTSESVDATNLLRTTDSTAESEVASLAGEDPQQKILTEEDLYRAKIDAFIKGRCFVEELPSASIEDSQSPLESTEEIQLTDAQVAIVVETILMHRGLTES